MIRLSTSCRSWLCLDTPTLCSRNRPIPFLYFQSTLRMYLYLCVYIERVSTCSIGEERQQLESVSYVNTGGEGQGQSHLSLRVRLIRMSAEFKKVLSKRQKYDWTSFFENISPLNCTCFSCVSLLCSLSDLPLSQA